MTDFSPITLEARRQWKTSKNQKEKDFQSRVLHTTKPPSVRTEYTYFQKFKEPKNLSPTTISQGATGTCAPQSKRPISRRRKTDSR